MRIRAAHVLIVTLLGLSMYGCKWYSLSGGRTFADSVTVSVITFNNSAPLAKPTLPQTMTEALREIILRQTRLKLVQQNGDLNYEGIITGYSIAPVAISGGGTDQAALNRLTISINIKYTDKIEEQYNFESSFSRFADFPSSQSLPAVEDQLIKEITDQIVQDIMNRSINAW
jgi:hypothetical protein